MFTTNLLTRLKAIIVDEHVLAVLAVFDVLAVKDTAHGSMVHVGGLGVRLIAMLALHRIPVDLISRPREHQLQARIEWIVMGQVKLNQLLDGVRASMKDAYVDHQLAVVTITLFGVLQLFLDLEDLGLVGRQVRLIVAILAHLNVFALPDRGWFVDLALMRHLLVLQIEPIVLALKRFKLLLKIASLYNRSRASCLTAGWPSSSSPDLAFC